MKQSAEQCFLLGLFEPVALKYGVKTSQMWLYPKGIDLVFLYSDKFYNFAL